MSSGNSMIADASLPIDLASISRCCFDSISSTDGRHAVAAINTEAAMTHSQTKLVSLTIAPRSNGCMPVLFWGEGTSQLKDLAKELVCVLVHKVVRY